MNGANGNTVWGILNSPQTARDPVPCPLHTRAPGWSLGKHLHPASQGLGFLFFFQVSRRCGWGHALIQAACGVFQAPPVRASFQTLKREEWTALEKWTWESGLEVLVSPQPSHSQLGGLVTKAVLTELQGSTRRPETPIFLQQGAQSRHLLRQLGCTWCQGPPISRT